MKKIVVLGAAGMAGHIMAEYLDSITDFQVFGFAREPGRFVTEIVDVLDFNNLETKLEKINPDYIVNCIGILVAQSNSNIFNAIRINSELPNFLSFLGEKMGFKLIHISTDCVFSGRDGNYNEDSFRDGDDNYARTKALGEIVNKKDLTIRTSIIGPELKTNGTGLLDWFLKQEGEISGYSKAYWSGVTTLELAKATSEFIRQDIVGLYQLCPIDKISKYDLLKLFASVWHKNIKIHPNNNYNVDKSLKCNRDDFSYTEPRYQSMLQEMKVWMDGHPGYYSHYI